MPDQFSGAAASTGGTSAFSGASGAGGIRGAFGALGNALSFGQVRRFQGYKEQFAPELQTYQEALRGGDTRSAAMIIPELRRRMIQDGAPRDDVVSFTGSMLKEIALTDLGHDDLGPNMRSATVRSLASLGLADAPPSNKEALEALDLGARMPGLAAQPGLYGAQTNLANAQANQLIPAQVGQMEANSRFLDARAENPALYGRMGGDVQGRRMEILTKADLALGKFAAMANKNEIGRDILEANLGLRNMVAQQLGLPQQEIVESQIADPRAKPGEPQYMTQYGFRDLPQQQQGGFGQEQLPADMSFEPSPGMQQGQPGAMGAGPGAPRGQQKPPREAYPFLPPTDAGTALSAVTQPAPETPLARSQAAQVQPGGNFRAAVQNPLGALPQELRSSLENSQPVSETALAQAYAAQGFTAQQTQQLLGELKSQFGAVKPTPSPTATPATRPTR